MDRSLFCGKTSPSWWAWSLFGWLRPIQEDQRRQSGVTRSTPPSSNGTKGIVLWKTGVLAAHGGLTPYIKNRIGLKNRRSHTDEPKHERVSCALCLYFLRAKSHALSSVTSHHIWWTLKFFENRPRTKNRTSARKEPCDCNQSEDSSVEELNNRVQLLI